MQLSQTAVTILHGFTDVLRRRSTNVYVMLHNATSIYTTLVYDRFKHINCCAGVVSIAEGKHP